MRLTRVVSTIDGTVLSTCVAVRAEAGVPAVTGVAVGVAASVVSPAPVGVQNNGRLLGCTAAAACASASLPVDLRVDLGGGGTNLLSADGAQESERGESERPVHLV